MTQAGPVGGRRYSGRDATERVRARRTAILDAALQLFGTTGYAATSVKQVCREAGLTERYFYESFADRHACLVALYDDLSASMRAATMAAVVDAGAAVNEGAEGAEGTVEQLARFGLSAFVGFLTHDPRRARVVLVQVVGVSPELERLRHGMLREFAELTTAVWLGANDQAGPSDAVRLTAVGLVGAVNHLLVDWLMNEQQDSPTLLTEVCVALYTAAHRDLAPCYPSTGTQHTGAEA